ncbi:DUF2627 domain-containing protein [Paenibacillus sp. IB182496]|uniref:DUF2627 domain-containing protein n=1 Tax=Paenibacillus sabuli TaxID=2772509 RepID=A0A927BXI3_9BACL|nr:DUF2627 domain-containing protein [Paenibacillus sabuli]MBD2847309.1 DUF2627 domain-containing protein [Paenibacillus sabuli]
MNARIVTARFIAVLLLVIPGLAAAYGFLALKEVFFSYFSDFGNDETTPQFMWGKFIIGALFFLAGVGFIGGWIFFRDRKRNYVAPRFKEKKKS